MILVEFNVKDNSLKCEIMNTYKAYRQNSKYVGTICYVNDKFIIYDKPAKDVQNVLAEFTNTSLDLIFTTRSGHGHKTTL